MAQTANNGEVGRLINLMPVGLKEAAIDSPTARATILHYGEQLEQLEKWLEDYLKATNRLLAESMTLENVINNFTQHAALPTTISETMMDHDYSVLAIKKYSECAKDFWMSMVQVVKKLNANVCDPIRHFQTSEIRPLREARRLVEQTQRNYDSLHGKFAALARSKEPSSIREEAFQLHEARKQYLQASMNFFQIAPHFRFALDKLVVRIFCDQYKEMRSSRDATASSFQRNSQEIERIQGWVREMEDSERVFKKELSTAKRQLEEAAEAAARPSRELDDYNASTISHPSHSHTASGVGISKSPDRSMTTAEKQGWLYLKTYTGKPTRTVWVKRWAFVRSGVFGWLIQGTRAGGVEESERIGVLLCSVRPALGEERRFCFELKTNKNTIVLQAETQGELLCWMREIEAAKAKAFENPASSDAVTPGSSQADPAFAITPPPVPEFGTMVLKSTDPGATDELPNVPRSDTLPPSLTDMGSQMDLHRRATAFDDASRDHASRIMSKLDLHKRTPTGPQISSPSTPSGGGGIASLIAASHGSMPVGPSLPMVVHSEQEVTPRKPLFTLAARDMPPSTLAPPTLASVPAPTSLSKSAVVVSGERGIRGSARTKDGIPNGILANTWGSSNGSYVNRFDKPESKATTESRLQRSPYLKSAEPVPEASNSTTMMTMDLALPPSATARSRTPSPSKGRRQTISNDQGVERPRAGIKLPDFPSVYPIQLKTQDAQFRLLFPNVRRDERLVMVFRGTWNPNDQQEFPGRVYVTTNEMYLYSNHFGMVLTAVVALSSVDEVTAAPGKDCDFLFMHLKEEATGGVARRITIKTFLEPLKLQQRRLNFLAQNSVAQTPLGLEDIIKRLLKMEHEVVRRTPSLESWEDISPDTPIDGTRTRSNTVDIRAPIRVDRSLFSNLTDREGVATKFKLPAQPVKYSPTGYTHLAVEREYDLSPKALFHVMFGDKSLLWQLLQHERRATDLKQGPWTVIGEGRLYRDFEFSVPTTNYLGQHKMSTVRDYQFVDVNNDHLCYVVTDKRTAWHLPNQKNYRLVSKIVITHVAKSKCKLAIYTKVEWLQEPWYLKNILDRQAMYDLDLDAQDTADLVTDQVRKLGAHSRTKKAIQIFGAVGQSNDVTQLQIGRSAIDIEIRRVPNSKTMTGLLIQDVTSVVESIVGTVLESLFSFVEWISKTINANSFILLLLGLSALYNSWFVLRDGHGWYQDRTTTKFLKRIGVGPNHVMSKSVYLNDIHEVMTGSGSIPNLNHSVCYQVFHDEHYLHDLDAPIIDNGKDDASLESAKRIQSARQQLGSYRHDLLVAMRVVNSLEKEMVRSEWESWLTAEHRKCRAIQPMIEKASNGTRRDVESSKEVKKWYNSYCMSCEDEYTRVRAI